jgi:hypothetical protein
MVKSERFKYGGKMYTRLIEEPYSSWEVAVDLGQRQDYTALSVIEHTRMPIPDDFEVDEAWKTIKEKVTERYAVRWLQRLPLGMDYPDQAARIAELLSRPPLRGHADLVIDDAGVGAPVADEFCRRWAVKPVRVTLSGTASEVIRHGPRKYTVPKRDLVSHLDARLNTGELVFADDIPEREALKDELTNFQRHVTATNRFTFEARSGKHDDIVLAVGFALWWAIEKRKRNRFHVGAVLGMY